MKPSIIDTGMVIETDGAWAVVRTSKDKACNECGKAQAGICGKGGAGMILRVKNPVGAVKGDTVKIELEKKTHYKAYYLAFILPLIMLFLGTAIGASLSRSWGIENLELVGGFSAFIITVVFSLKKIHSLDKSKKMYIADIIHNPPSNECEMNLRPEEMDYLAGFRG